MFKKLLNLKDITILNNSQLKNTHGGINYTITCEFSDGGNWSGLTQSASVAKGMASHCVEGGGSPIYTNSLFDTEE